MGLKYPIGSQIAEDFSRVVVDPAGDGLDHFVGDFVEVRTLRQPAPDHFIQIFVAAAIV